MNVTITTLNMQGFFSWKEREAHILAYLQTAQPDIVLFQEVTFLPDEAPYNQVSLLNQQLKYPYEHSAITRLQESPHYTTYREGLAMLSKYPVARTETIVLKQNPADQHQRLVEFIDIRRADGTILKLANIHFSITDDTEAFARAQLQEVLEIIQNRNEFRVIAGDFNMRQLEQHADLWDENYTASTQSDYVSYPKDNKRLDYFLVPNEYTQRTLTLSPDGLSDHRAVTLQLQVSQPRAIRASSQRLRESMQRLVGKL